MYDFKCVDISVFHTVLLHKISVKFGVWVGSRFTWLRLRSSDGQISTKCCVWVGSRMIWLRLGSSDGQDDNVRIPSQVSYVFTMWMSSYLQEDVWYWNYANPGFQAHSHHCENAYYFRHVPSSVCHISECISAAFTGRIRVKFANRDFY